MEADMADPLITKTQLAQLIANGARNAAGEDIDPRPVVKLLRPTLARLGCSLKPIPTNQTVFSVCVILGSDTPKSAMPARPKSGPYVVCVSSAELASARSFHLKRPVRSR